MKTFDLPWYDTNPRRVLAHLNKEIKEENIGSFKKNDDIILSSPIFLAFIVGMNADDHLKRLNQSSKQLGINISRKQTKKLYAELLSAHYFFLTLSLSKYIHDNLLTLFVLRTHVALLDNIQKKGIGSWILNFNPFTKRKRTEENEKAVSKAIQEGANFYLRNILDENDKQEFLEDVNFINGKKDAYEDGSIAQFIIKINYKISKILSIRKNPSRFIMIFATNSSMFEKSKIELIQKIRPVWHLSGDKKVIRDYKMENQEQ